MSSITPVTIKTGRRGEHREFFCQLRDTGVITNGHDPNQVFSLRATTCYDLGIAAPSAAPTGADQGAGSVDGTVRYRTKWRDSVTGAMSLSSSELTYTTSAQIVRITYGGTPPARATHWILERTTDGGKVFFPVNRTAAAPDGTAIATTTYDDNVADSTLRNRIALSNKQGVPGPYQFCFTNSGRVFMGGGRIHSPTVTVTNGSANVTSADGGFTSDMIGHDLSIADDTDGKSYKISAVGGANALTLASNYTGTTGSKTANITGYISRVIWSEAGDAEAYGSQEVGFLSNELVLGDAGEAVRAGVGLGVRGVLWAKETCLYHHSYTLNPDPVNGDGRVTQLPVRRGALGPLAMKFVNGKVYGIDHLGIWSMSPDGGQPVEIGQPLAHEWKRSEVNLCQGKNWHIGVDLKYRWLYFFLGLEGDATSYPHTAYIYDMDREVWIGSKTWKNGITCNTELFDTENFCRLGIFNAAPSSEQSHLWCDNIGKSLGAQPTSTLSGTVTAGGNTTLTDSTAAFVTTGEALKGVEVIKTDSSGGEESRIITGNTSTQLTVNSAWTINPVAGDTYWVGPIHSVYLTPRMNGGAPERKKCWNVAYVWMKYKTTCTNVNVRAYYDGIATADSDHIATINAEDGITITANKASIKAIPTTAGVYRFEIPLMNKPANDLQLEFWSKEPGVPWEISSIKVLYDVDQRSVEAGPTKK